MLYVMEIVSVTKELGSEVAFRALRQNNTEREPRHKNAALWNELNTKSTWPGHIGSLGFPSQATYTTLLYVAISVTVGEPIQQGCWRQLVKWAPSVGCGVFFQVRTWNFPALVKYLTPLNGLYFSPYMSRRLTLRPVQRGKEKAAGLQLVRCLQA